MLYFGIIISLMLVGNALLLWHFHAMQTEADQTKAIDQQLMEILRVHDFLMTFKHRVDDLAQSRSMDRVKSEAPELRAQVTNSLGKTQALFKNLPSEAVLDATVLSKLQAIQACLPSEVDALESLGAAGDWNAIRRRGEMQFHPLVNTSTVLVDTTRVDAERKRLATAEYVKLAHHRERYTLAGAAVASLLMAVFLGVIITRSITSPLRTLVHGSSALAQGDFEHRVPVIGSDELAHLAGVFNETTLKLQSLYELLQTRETYLAKAQELSHTGSFGWSKAGHDFVWSDETLRIFGYMSREQPPTLEALLSRVHTEDLPLVRETIGRASSDAEEVDLEFRIGDENGAVKHVRLVAQRVRRGSGQQFAGAITDITASKLAEAALNKAHSQLTEVAQATALNVLTASIAHEINQPLASLITNASICLRRLNADPPNVEGARETARRAIRDGNRASDVITRLRALFAKKEVTRESLDLNEAAREVIAMLADQLQRKRVLLVMDFEGDLPVVTGDRTQIQQVIMNLLRNASDAMSGIDDRPRELVIRTEREEGDRVRLSVRDAGIGLEPQETDQLFQAFHTTKSDGMGIGLAISRSIIETHQGRLWAAPNLGPGTTFSFSIPSRQAHPVKPCFAIGFISNGEELKWMPVVLQMLQDEFPNLDIVTSSQFSPYLAEALSKGQIDAALLRREAGWSELGYETLLSSRFIVYMPKRHHLAALREIDPQDLVGETFLTVARTAPVMRRAIDDYLTESGASIRVSHEVDHPGQAVSLILSTGGVMILPPYLQNFLPDSVTTRPLKGGAPTIDLVFGYNLSNQSPVLKFLLSHLDELVARVTKKESLEPSGTGDKELPPSELRSDPSDAATPSDGRGQR